MQRIALNAIARRRLSWLIILVASVIVARPAQADPRTEKEAQALQKKAIEEDNLNVNYAGAVKKLQSAVTKCDGDKCNSNLKASLLRDLGAMQILNGAADEGKASFGQALALDASVELDPSYKNPQLEGIWAEVKKKGGGAAAPVKPPPPPPEGDFSVTPPTEAQVRTPLPVYVEYSGSEDLTRVTVKYKGTGQSDWKSLDLPKLDTGYGALIPCKDVAQGLMLYFVQGFTDQKDPVATSGSKKQPFSVPVNAQLVGPAPALPGQEPPAQCEEVVGAGSGECPPDFPGCAKKKGADEECEKNNECDSGQCTDGKCGSKKENGDECEKDGECSSGTCTSNKCSGGKKVEGEDCESDEDCDSGKCKEDKCTAVSSSGRGGKGSKLWIGLSLEADWNLLPSANDVCSRTTGHLNSAGYTCNQPGSTAQFPTADSTSPYYYQNLVLGQDDQVKPGGFRFPSNFRILATLDYAVNQNIMLGLHAGYVLGTDPSKPAFAPIHIEARFAYLLGKNAATKKGISPMLLAALGAGEFDAFVPVVVHLAPPKGTPQVGTVDAWLTAGPIFAAVGGGARILISPKVAMTAALKLQMAFGGAAASPMLGFAPELGIQFGL